MNKRVVITLLLVSSMTVLAGAIIAPSLPGLKASFEPNPGADLLAKLMLTLPALFIAITAGLAGWLTDKLGRKPVLITALVLYAIGGTSGLYFSDPYWLLAGRAVLGLAVGAVLTVATTLAGDYFEGENRGKFLSWQAAFMAFGGTAFLSLGGLLGTYSWRAPFAMYFASLLLLPLVFLLKPPTLSYKKAIPGADTAAVNIPYGPILLVYAVGLLGHIVFYILPVQIPFLLEHNHGIGPQGVGLSLAAVTGMAGFASFYFHRMRGKRSHQQMALISFGIMGIGFLGIA
jgi:MFS family permease